MKFSYEGKAGSFSCTADDFEVVMTGCEAGVREALHHCLAQQKGFDSLRLSGRSSKGVWSVAATGIGEQGDSFTARTVGNSVSEAVETLKDWLEVVYREI